MAAMALAVGDTISLRFDGTPPPGGPIIHGFPVPPVAGVITFQLGTLNFITWESPGEATISQPAGAVPIVLDRLEPASTAVQALYGKYVTPSGASTFSAEYRGMIVRTYRRNPRGDLAVNTAPEFVVIRTDRGLYLEMLASEVTVVLDR